MKTPRVTLDLVAGCVWIDGESLTPQNSPAFCDGLVGLPNSEKLNPPIGNPAWVLGRLVRVLRRCEHDPELARKLELI